MSNLKDAELMKEIRELAGFTQSQIADVLGYSGNRAIRAIETGDKSMSGPARAAAEYLAQGLLDDDMKLIVPEFGLFECSAGAAVGEILLRNYFPRFLGIVHDNEMPGLENIKIFPDPMYLTIINWLDNPIHSNKDTIIKRAASYVEGEYQLGS